MNIFMTYRVVQLHDFYLKYYNNYIRIYGKPISFNDYLLEFDCAINNNKDIGLLKQFLVKFFKN